MPISAAPPHRVRQTLDALAALDQPGLEVLVVDHNTADPAQWEPVAEHCARLGERFRFFHLGPFPGGRAGALNFALGETAAGPGRVVGVIGCGDLPNRDWLRRLLPAFDRPELALACAARGESGATGWWLLRQDALAAAGGWAEWASCAESELLPRLLRQGWEVATLPGPVGQAATADEAACRAGRQRRAMAAGQILRAHRQALFSPFRRELTAAQRRSLLLGWLPWLGEAAALLLLARILAWSAARLAGDRPVPPVLLALGLGLGLARLLGAARPGGLALAHVTGKAVWQGLLLPRGSRRGPASRREEALLLAALWVAAPLIGLAPSPGGWAPLLWAVMLLLLSLPNLATMIAALRAAMPGEHAPFGLMRLRH
jgi:hypothetical protein